MTATLISIMDTNAADRRHQEGDIMNSTPLDTGALSHLDLRPGPIVLSSRNSGTQSRAARVAAATEMHAVAADLHAATGIDVRERIPSVEHLIQSLVNGRKVTTRGSDGKSFTNEFTTIIIDEHLILFLSTGSGRKISDEFQQPFILELTALMTAHKPSLLGCHRLDRIFRTMMPGAALVNVMQELGTKLFDEERNPLTIDDFQALKIMVRSKGAKDEAGRIPIKTREGMANRTDRKMTDGEMDYAANVAPPPGLTRIRTLAPNGTRGKGQVILDTPSTYPEAGTVIGLPQVTLNGEPVDQVANVTWALSVLGKPEHGISQVGLELADRHFSTDRLRMMHGSDAHFDREELGSAGWRAVRAIVANLDFYESGILPIKLGVEGVPDFAITGCFPPSGKWAEPEDFERIREYLGQTTGGGPAGLALTGVQVTTDAGAGVLRKAPPARSRSGAAYVIRAVGEAFHSPVGLPALPHQSIAECIVQALVEQADSVWTAFVHAESPQLASTKASISRLEHELEVARAEADAILTKILATDVEGNSIYGTATLTELGRRHEEFQREHIVGRASELARLKAVLDADTAALTGNDKAAAVEELLNVVASLRDPQNTAYNDLWKRAFGITSIRRDRFVVHGHTGTKTVWAGTLRLKGAGEIFEIAIHGEFLDGVATELGKKVDEAIRALLQGVPFEQIPVTQRDGVRAAIAERFEIESKRFGLASCPDGRLTRIGAALIFEGERSVSDVARALREPVELVEAVRQQLDRGRTTWAKVMSLASSSARDSAN